MAVPAPVRGIVERLEGAGFESWCVGGALRDILLGTPHADFDVATAAPPKEVRRLFRRTVPVGERFGTIGVLDDDGVLHEVTTFRRDVSTDGRHAVVEFGASLDDDLARRDFTINSLAYHPIRQVWHDPYGGTADLEARTVRAVGDPATRFREDYLRILRALRFAARFGFAIDGPTWDALRREAPGLARLSAERVRDEWFKGLRSAGDLRQLVALWHDAGAAAAWLPGLRAAPDVPASLSAEPRDPVLLSAALLDDAAGTLERLRCSNAEVGRAAALARGPRAPAGSSETDARRWLHAVGASAGDAIALHRLEHGTLPPWASTVETVRARGDAVQRGQLAISGADLQALGLHGADIGTALDGLLARVLEDPALNERERLLALARERA